MKRDCPMCGKPAVTLWRLLWLGGIRRTVCVHCGTKISVSPVSFLVVITVGTWLPVAGAVLGAMLLPQATGIETLAGGVVGFIASVTVFAVLYFRAARLVPA